MGSCLRYILTHQPGNWAQLLLIECLKEFKGMLRGQKIKVYTDHKNLVQVALGLRQTGYVYPWRLVLEEYDPEIV